MGRRLTREKDVPSGACKVCAHSERIRIELLLAAGGASHASIGRKYGLTRHSLGRHWDNHVSAQRKAALAFGPVNREALASRVAEESSSVIDHFRAIRAGLYHLYDAAVTANDGQTGAQLGGRLIECLNSMARITGQLATSSLVSVTQNNFFLADPAFATFQARLIAALRPFPDARNAVIAEFERIESATASPAHKGVTYEQH